jgi:transketolase
MKALREVWADTLVSLAREDPRIVMLDGDLANSTKADKFAAAHPDRFLEMGIAEQNMVGVAVGMAAVGFVPWLSTFTVFFTHRAIDPIRMLVAQTNANVKIGAAYSGLMTGYTGKTHQDVEDLAIMRAMPGMTVLAPADQYECAAMIKWATNYQGPVYLRLTRDASADVFTADYQFAFGEIRWLRRGKHALLISNELAKQEVEVGVLHIPSIKPLNEAALIEACSAYDLIFTVEEHSIFGGLGGLVAELLSANSPRRVIRYGLEDKWGESAPNDFLLDKYGLSALQVSRRIASDFQNKK